MNHVNSNRIFKPWGEMQIEKAPRLPASAPNPIDITHSLTHSLLESKSAKGGCTVWLKTLCHLRR